MLTIDWSDGDMLNVTVQAYDILGEYNEETIIVYRDATPPIIQKIFQCWIIYLKRNLEINNT
jgi:hypothetical protein